MKAKILPYVIGLLMVGCTNHAKKESIKDSLATKDSIAKRDSPKERNYLEETLATVPKDAKPIMGYRFFINGDFDGDGKKETLTEHYISGVDGKETNKFYDSSVDYDQLVALTIKKEPISYITCGNKKIDTLFISDGGQLLGLSMLRNEGDLNGDGRDEISYIVNWADWSSVNSCHIYSYTKKGWRLLHTFEIRDWQLPDLPETQKIIGLFGVVDINSTHGNDTINAFLEKEVKNFPGFISRIKKGLITVETFTVEAFDVVDTIKLPRIIK